MPRANRPFITHEQYNVQYNNLSQALISLNEKSTSAGDMQIAVARSIMRDNNTAMSLWMGMKLPTGNKDKLTSNGATDFSAWLALDQQLAKNWLINLNAGSVILGTDSYRNIPLSDHVFYGHVALGLIFNESINLKLQLQGHSSYYDQSQLNTLADTYLLTFGGTIKIGQCNQLDIAMSEDIKVDASPDASLLISWRNSTSCG